MVRQFIVGQPECDKLVAQYLTRMHWSHAVFYVHGFNPSMVIHDFNIAGFLVFPAETYPPLLIYSNTILTITVSSECFEPITWQVHKVLKGFGVVKIGETPRCLVSKPLESWNPLAFEKGSGVSILEAPDHDASFQTALRQGLVAQPALRAICSRLLKAFSSL